MIYAIIEKNFVTNIIELNSENADDFPNAVSSQDLPIQIGDRFIDGKFYRGDNILTNSLPQVTQQLFAELSDLDNALVDLTYQSYMGGEEVL